jgi:hypothetical protein
VTVRRNVEFGLELKGTQEIVVDIPRPRGLDVPTAPRFVALKRQVLALIREEAMVVARRLTRPPARSPQR